MPAPFNPFVFEAALLKHSGAPAQELNQQKMPPGHRTREFVWYLLQEMVMFPPQQRLDAWTFVV